ncbi:unnamed protein product [Rotaria socialis]
MNLNDTNITSDIQLVQELQPILKKKCHGNRSDQRFRQSCRKKNMDETTITQLIEQRRNDRKRNQTDQAANNTDINKQNMHTKISDISMGHEQSLDKNGNQSRIITTTIEKPNKRKRDALPKEKTYNVAKSSSQLSFFQTSIKKKKKNNKKQKKNNNNKKQKSRIWRSKIKKTIKNRNHRQSAYLKVSWNTLMNNLKIHLKSPLKKRNEQKFVYARLYLFDEEFTLDLDQYLWKSYLDLGSQQQQQQQPEVWPSEVYRMAKTNEPDLCKQYIVEYLNEIKIHLDLCRIKLNTQAQSWISTLPSLEILDDNLKQYVRLQNKHLSTTIDKQLARYKNVLEEKKVLQQISFYLTPNDQVLMDELINLQQIQIQLLEEFNMLEQRIICKILPPNVDSLDHLIQSHLYTPLVHDTTSIEFKIQSDRIIQQIKRTWLNIYYKAYEMKIQEYEKQYKENLHMFQLRFEFAPTPTPRQSQVALDIASSQIEHFDQDNNQQNVLPMNPTVQTKDRNKKFNKALFLHYTHEKRLRPLKRDIHEIYQSTFKHTIIRNVNLIVGYRNNPKSKTELIRHKRPHASYRRHDFKAKNKQAAGTKNKPST